MKNSSFFEQYTGDANANDIQRHAISKRLFFQILLYYHSQYLKSESVCIKEVTKNERQCLCGEYLITEAIDKPSRTTLRCFMAHCLNTASSKMFPPIENLKQNLTTNKSSNMEKVTSTNILHQMSTCKHPFKPRHLHPLKRMRDCLIQSTQQQASLIQWGQRSMLEHQICHPSVLTEQGELVPERE